MRIFYVFLIGIVSTFQLKVAFAQQFKFTRITKNIPQATAYTAVAQDHRGFIWITDYVSLASKAVLYRYDGPNFTAYRHDDHNPNSIQNSMPGCMTVDRDNHIWIGFYGGGMDRFDPLTGVFTHFHHNPKDGNSLCSDSLVSLLEDHSGNLWIGTRHGLDRMNIKTGQFSHFRHADKDAGSLSSDIVTVLYEDHEGRLWVGCSSATILAGVSDPFGQGGLNLFNSRTGKFTRYLHNPSDPYSIPNNKITALYEDSKGVFWVGTMSNGVHTLDPNTGRFTNYPYNPSSPGQIGSLPMGKEFMGDQVGFFREDPLGGFWIGSSTAGLTRYDRAAKKTVHFGSLLQDRKVIYKDTAGGVDPFGFMRAAVTPNGMMWFATNNPAAVYVVNFNRQTIPFTSLNANGNAFYQEPGGDVLWVGTNKGLLRKDRLHHTEKVWSKDEPHNSGWAHDTIGNMARDKDGIFWIATLGGGLCRFDPIANKAVNYLHDAKDPNSISSNLARNLLIDHNHHIWVGTWGAGLDIFDPQSQKFKHIAHPKDNSPGATVVDCTYEDSDSTIWAGTFDGIELLDKAGTIVKQYLRKTAVLTFFTDKSGVIWAGTSSGICRYDKAADNFALLNDDATAGPIGEVMDIQEDSRQNLWLRTASAIIKINPERTDDRVYGDAWGVNTNGNWISRSLEGRNGELFFGTLGGYYDFSPEQIKDIAPPVINITDFDVDNASVQNSDRRPQGIDTPSVSLSYKENSFSVEFLALHYSSPGEESYQAMLQNYDHTWRDLNTEHRTSFFDVPPGTYTLQMRAFNADGVRAEKDLTVVIHPPWWKTWWAYALAGLAATGCIWAFIQYRSRQLISKNKLLEQKVNLRTQELQQSLQELKTTQTQLIQAEKMASLGELTAGIAHEIQNPLNFVNNFSEVNREMLEELKAESTKPKVERDEQLEIILINDLIENERKIIHHGKRADAIVKGMLEHSRTGTGQKQATDVNALVDEFLKLSYHGLRAKHKNFNAKLVTHFDKTLPAMQLVQQDMGRVFLNLFNNAFYAVAEKQKTAGADYKPTVEVTTFADAAGWGASVKDNGNGIPKNIKDKIMQPFYTTKPTGEGTGLGLSLAYDIVVKGHGGSLTVNSTPGQGSEFVVLLPV
jgi:signal transduction histidine kinase/ligand-binding sensor domain-containing protein